MRASVLHISWGPFLSFDIFTSLAIRAEFRELEVRCETEAESLFLTSMLLNRGAQER